MKLLEVLELLELNVLRAVPPAEYAVCTMVVHGPPRFHPLRTWLMEVVLVWVGFIL